MKRISSELEPRIIELWFEGFARDEIAKRLNISGSTVSNVVSSLPSWLEPLRDLSVELKKNNLLTIDALDGAKFKSELLQLGVESHQVRVFIQTVVKKIVEDSSYQPREVIEAAMKLLRVEQDLGKPYLEAISEFEANAQRNKGLIDENLRLKREVEQNKLKRKYALKKAKVTEKEISYVKELDSGLQLYGVYLKDADFLRNFLNNIEETGANSKKFVSFTKEHGSFAQSPSHIKAEINKESINRDELKKQNQSEKAEYERLQTQHQNFVINASAENQRIKDAISAAQANLDRLNADIQSAANRYNEVQLATKEEENKRQSVMRETEGIFGIKNFATEYQNALALKYELNLSLDEELEKKKDRLALADAVTDFLTRQSKYDFDRFYSLVKEIGKIRNEEYSPFKPAISSLEDSVRFQALNVFNGDIYFNAPLKTLWETNNRLIKENFELRNKLINSRVR